MLTVDTNEKVWIDMAGEWNMEYSHNTEKALAAAVPHIASQTWGASALTCKRTPIDMSEELNSYTFSTGTHIECYSWWAFEYRPIKLGWIRDCQTKVDYRIFIRDKKHNPS